MNCPLCPLPHQPPSASCFTLPPPGSTFSPCASPSPRVKRPRCVWPPTTAVQMDSREYPCDRHKTGRRLASESSLPTSPRSRQLNPHFPDKAASCRSSLPESPDFSLREFRRQASPRNRRFAIQRVQSCHRDAACGISPSPQTLFCKNRSRPPHLEHIDMA